MQRELMYDKSLNLFVGVRKEKTGERFECGKLVGDYTYFCHYCKSAESAYTYICFVPHTKAYMDENCIPVREVSDFASWNGFGWHVRTSDNR